MTALQLMEAKLRGQDPNPRPDRWEDAPAPGRVGERVAEGVFDQPIPVERSPLVTNVVHWAYGSGWGIVYAIARSSLPGRTPMHALAFGSAVWSSAYAVLPAMGIYEPPWRYRASTLAVDLGRHLVYAGGVAAAYDLLARRR